MPKTPRHTLIWSATWVAFQKAQINSGKAQGAEEAVVWLSLEELDDDVLRLLTAYAQEEQNNRRR